MDFNQILMEVTEIFKKILRNKNIVLDANTTAKDVEAWDSLSHIQLMVAIEKHFNIVFSSTELIKKKNVGELISVIEQKLKNK